MKLLILLAIFLCPVTVFSAEPEPPPAQAEEPKLYDHYLALKRMQESLAGRSLEEQAKLQPTIQRAERKACDRFRKERREGVPKEDYRSQGGDEFLVFSHQFEQYCETLR
jgi:hypothetical protein